MADITPPLSGGRQLIQSYGEGGFRVAGAVYIGSIRVFRERTIRWDVSSVGAITVAALEPVLSSETSIRILLVGCGARIGQLDPPVRSALRAAGIGVELMDTGAACRTFNVLLAEERVVAAALIAVD